MCVIVTVPKEKQLSKEVFQRCWNANPHGGGLMYSDGSKVIVEKELRSCENFWDQFQAAKRKAESDIVLHFRISTSGKIDLNNCHPFPADKGFWLMHNGILPVDVPKKSKINDTQIFIRDYLSELPLDNDYVRITLGRLIGGYNKIAIMAPNGNVYYINKERGRMFEDMWFSNLDWNATKRGHFLYSECYE